MNRRLFLSLAAAGATTGLFAQTPAKSSLGFSLYGMRSLPIDDALAACAKIGYDAVELAVMPDWPADPKKLSKDDRKRIRERLAEHKLSLSALMENLPLTVSDAEHATQLDRLKRAAELGHELSPKQPPIIETILGGKPGEWAKVREVFTKRLNDWAKVSLESKVVIALKPHRFGALNRPDDVVKLLADLDAKAIRLAFDWSHYEQREWKLADTMKQLMPLSVFVHVKDTVLVKEQAKFVLPGEGSTNYAEYFKLLSEHNYRGCVCVEVSGQVSNAKGYDPLAAAKSTFAALSTAKQKSR